MRYVWSRVDVMCKYIEYCRGAKELGPLEFVSSKFAREDLEATIEKLKIIDRRSLLFK